MTKLTDSKGALSTGCLQNVTGSSNNKLDSVKNYSLFFNDSVLWLRSYEVYSYLNVGLNEDSNKRKISIFPNPASYQFTVSGLENLDCKLRILNSLPSLLRLIPCSNCRE